MKSLKPLLVASCLSLGACSSLTLYDEDRDKAATDAKAEFAKIDLPAYFKAQRARMTKLRDDELETVQRLAEVRGRRKMIRLIGISPAGSGLFNIYRKAAEADGAQTVKCDETADGPVRHRMCQLGIDTLDEMKAVRKALLTTQLRFNINSHIPHEDLRGILGARTPTCDDLRFLKSEVERENLRSLLAESAPKEKRQKVAKDLEQFDDACGLQTEAFDKFAKRTIAKAFGPGAAADRDQACTAILEAPTSVARSTVLASALCRLWKTGAEIVAAKAAAAAVAGRLKALAKEIADAKGKPFDADTFDKAVNQALDKVKPFLEGASEAPKLFGKESGANTAWIDAVGSLLEAIEKGEPPAPGEGDPEGLQQARVLFASFKDIVRKAAAVGDALVAPVPAELLIEHDFLSVEKSYLDKRLELIAAKRSATADNLRAAMLQGDLLSRILELRRKESVCGDANRCHLTPAELNAGLSAENRKRLYTALAYASLALGPAAAAVDKDHWERTHLSHLEIVIERERALEETRTLAAGGLTDLEAFHKFGIKREEIVALVGRIANLGLLGGILNEN